MAEPRALERPTRQAAELYRDLLRERFGARLLRVTVFGSRARGDHEPESDVDVAVVVRDLTEAERDAVIEIALDAWRRSGSQLAPLVWSEEQWLDRVSSKRRIAVDIEREGVPL
jgi:predicted nucleotidyltransferase